MEGPLRLVTLNHHLLVGGNVMPPQLIGIFGDIVDDHMGSDSDGYNYDVHSIDVGR